MILTRPLLHIETTYRVELLTYQHVFSVTLNEDVLLTWGWSDSKWIIEPLYDACMANIRKGLNRDGR